MLSKARIFAKTDTISFFPNDQVNYFIIFDYEGRVNFIFNEGKSYRRGFDNTIICSDVHSFYFLHNKESEVLINESYEVARYIINSNNFEIHYLGGKQNDVIDAFEKISNSSYKTILEDVRKFKSIYKPITILPPDQYLSLYIPITEGCSYNKCSFCNLYKDRSFRIRNKKEISLIVEDIANYFGKTLLTRKGIFLGEGNVFVESTLRIIEIIKEIKNTLKENKYLKFDLNNCFYGFMDTFHTRKTRDEISLLKDIGVKRIYIGLETGNDFLLSNILLKPSNSENALNTIRTIKDVGISVGIIIIVGIGGKKYKDKHFEDTVKLIYDMKLSEGDIVYLSPIVEYADSQYKEIMDKNNIERLNEKETEEEILRFKRSLSKIEGIKIPIYRVDKFLYA
ncbi:MAG: radical SAM protein [Brevinematia bacterium]